MRERRRARRPSQRGRSGVVDQPQLDGRAARGEALEHVAVGREVVAVGDERARGAPSSAADAQLVEVDGRRVADDHLAGPRAEHALGQQVADARGRVDPVVPAGDELARPTASTTRARAGRAWRPAGGRASCRRGRSARASAIDEALAEAARAGRRASSAAASSRRHGSHSITACHSGFAGSRCPKWSSSGEHARASQPVARGEAPRSSPAARCRPCRRASTARARRAAAARRATPRRSGPGARSGVPPSSRRTTPSESRSSPRALRGRARRPATRRRSPARSARRASPRAPRGGRPPSGRS